MQRTDHAPFCPIFSALLVAAILFASGCDISGSGSSEALIGQRAFGFTGEPQQFVVPEGVTSITVSAFGARGGNGWNADGAGSMGGLGGLGGQVEATLTVTPGETLYIYVGGAGTDGTPTESAWPPPGSGGWNGGGSGRTRDDGYTGGGGGGASDIRRGGQDESDRILVAGGGGSGSGWCTSGAGGAGNGGDGGGAVGGDGQICDTAEDLPLQCDTLPSVSVGGELGLQSPFTNSTKIIAGTPTTDQRSSCDPNGEDQDGVDNILLTITNDTTQDFEEVYYVANPETTITNFDGLIDGEEAFKIDSDGDNTPLVDESLTPDGIFEADETWTFILQDYSNTLGLSASDLASIGIPSEVADFSSGSIVGIVAGNGGTDVAGGWGWTRGGFGVGATQQNPEKFDTEPKDPFSLRASGAGGAGWYGGGTSDGSGGGGGSSYVTPVGSSGIIHRQGVRDGNGLIVIGTN